MEFKMTTRDKKLLSFVGVLVIGVAFLFLLILPGVDKIQEQQSQIERMETEKQEMETLFVLEPELKTTNTTLKAEQISMASYFLPVMSSQTIDRRLTGTILSCGLSALDLKINIPETPVSIEPYKESSMYKETQLQFMTEQTETGDENAAQSAGNPSEPEQAINIYAAEVSLNTAGNLANLQKLIDTWNDSTQPIHITEYNLHSQKEDGKDTGDYQMDMKLKVYMCQDTTEKEGAND